MTVDGVTVIPAGTEMVGSVTAGERAGRMSGADRITVRFHAVLRDGTETPLETTAISRSGPGQSGQNATGVGGGAAAGAILGSIFGGRKGAAIGSAIGAVGGTGAAAVQRAGPAVLERGATLTLQTTRATTIETS